jgi:hypothetical protein
LMAKHSHFSRPMTWQGGSFVARYSIAGLGNFLSDITQLAFAHSALAVFNSEPCTPAGWMRQETHFAIVDQQISGEIGPYHAPGPQNHDNKQSSGPLWCWPREVPCNLSGRRQEICPVSLKSKHFPVTRHTST